MVRVPQRAETLILAASAFVQLCSPGPRSLRAEHSRKERQVGKEGEVRKEERRVEIGEEGKGEG